MNLKIISRLLLALCCASLIHGCGKGAPSADNPPTLSAEEKAKFDAAAAKAAQQAPVNATPAQ